MTVLVTGLWQYLFVHSFRSVLGCVMDFYEMHRCAHCSGKWPLSGAIPKSLTVPFPVAGFLGCGIGSHLTLRLPYCGCLSSLCRDQCGREGS